MRTINGRTPGYASWKAMRNRCNNPRSQDYKLYGGRGIRVCERWNSFEAFFSDMGPRPEGMSIDRIDSDKDYEPANCRWATSSQQANNKRCNILVPWCAERTTLRQYCADRGLRYDFVKQRVRHGSSVLEAICNPLKKNKSRRCA